jgi:hypothetical protein
MVGGRRKSRRWIYRWEGQDVSHLSTTPLQNMYTTTPWPLALLLTKKYCRWSAKEEDRKNKGHGAQDTC